MTDPHSPHLPPMPYQGAPHLDPAVAGLQVQQRRRGALARAFGRGLDPATAGDPAPSPADVATWTQLLATPVSSPRRTAVVALKGGVGKTTLSVLLANTLARARQDPVVLFDADTTFGSLALRTSVPLRATAHELAAAGDPGRFDVLSGVLARSADGAWVLPSGRDPDQSAALTEAVYVGAMNAVFRHFPVMVTDSGAGLATPLMRRVVSGCHSLVIATSPSIDGLLASHNALRFLADHGLAGLASRSIVAVTGVPAEGAPVDLLQARARFAGLAGDFLTVPADPHLRAGGQLVLDALQPGTRAAATRLAASALGAALAAG